MSEATVYRNELELDSTLGEYRLTAVLGAGGFGMTYLAWDANLEKKVAIKEYLPGDLALRALDGSVVPVSSDQQHDYRWGLDRFIGLGGLDRVRFRGQVVPPGRIYYVSKVGQRSGNRLAKYPAQAFYEGKMVMDMELLGVLL